MKYFFLALSFLTILPVPQRLYGNVTNLPRTLAAFPLAGAVQGLLAYGVCWGFQKLLPVSTAFVLSIFFYHFINGGLHLDGLVDFSDAWFGAKKDATRFREILKDSRIGTMGAFAILLYFAVFLSSAGFIPLTAGTFIFIGMSGRVCILLCATYSRPLFETGIAKSFIQQAGFPELFIGLLSFFAAMALLGDGYFIAGCAVFLWSVLYKIFIIKSRGGFSGDLLGAGCCLAELVAALLAVRLAG